MKKSFLLLLIFLNFSNVFFSQEIINALNASWTTVIPGQVICEPSVTSYGFSLITDAQQISAFSNRGKILWEKTLERSRNAFVSTLNGDFFAVVNHNGNKLTVLNPSGCEIWSKELDFSIIDKPFSGRDGRFFIRGSNTLQCYGINGICRWHLETPLQSPLPVLELNDGSLVVFMQEKVQDKTKALRISPFGEALEEIIFTGQVLHAFSCDQGILLNFTDGTAGMFSVANGTVQNKWVLMVSVNDKDKIAGSSFLVSADKGQVAFLLPSKDRVEVYGVNQEDGSIIYTFTVDKINGYELVTNSINSEGIFLSDQNSARFYSLQGVDLWNAVLPSKSAKESFNYSFITLDNHLVLCGQNWSLNAYRFSQSSGSVPKKNITPRSYPDYIQLENKYFTLEHTNYIDRDLISEQQMSALKNGNYGSNEILWLTQMLGNCQILSDILLSTDFGIREEPTVFENDTNGINKLLQQLPLYATVPTVNYTAFFLKELPHTGYIKTLLLGVAKNGYDPEGKILEAIEYLSKKYTIKDERLINAICDAIYSICFFMGRPAFNSKGKNILARFLSSDYSIKARTYTRNTLKKIADLDL